MARYLIDTHILLWWLTGAETLSQDAQDVICDGGNGICLSAGAIWEMAIKRSLGRLEFPDDIEAVLKEEHIEVLPVTAPHALAAGALPSHHRDPFDRIQIAQAQLEGLTLISRDEALGAYDVDLLRG